MYKAHDSVLKKEITKVFLSGTLVCDCTFGGGGHSFSLLESSDNLKIVACDQDYDAIENGRVEIERRGFSERVHLIHCHFKELMEKVLARGLRGAFSGVIFDLGVSSHHLATPGRGFSFQHEGPLDMRMNQYDSNATTAKDLLLDKSEGEIAEVLYLYGEERHARRIAAAICKFRENEEIKDTKQLENIVFHCYPKRDRHRGIHPATKTFQALRLYVNRELEVLGSVLDDACEVLAEEGHMAVISFHSLEDRIVKHSFRMFGKEGRGSIVTKKPIVPTAREQEENRSSRSAKMRIFRKGVGVS